MFTYKAVFDFKTRKWPRWMLREIRARLGTSVPLTAIRNKSKSVKSVARKSKAVQPSETNFGKQFPPVLFHRRVQSVSLSISQIKDHPRSLTATSSNIKKIYFRDLFCTRTRGIEIRLFLNRGLGVKSHRIRFAWPDLFASALRSHSATESMLLGKTVAVRIASASIDIIDRHRRLSESSKS